MILLRIGNIVKLKSGSPELDLDNEVLIMSKIKS